MFQKTVITVVFRSIRGSRVTGPQIHEYFRGCHRSPRPTTNLQKKSQKPQEKAKNSKFSPPRCFGVGFATALTRLTFFVTRGERKLCCPFRDLEEVWKPTHGEDGRKKELRYPIDVAPFFYPTCLGGTRNTSRQLNWTYFA